MKQKSLETGRSLKVPKVTHANLLRARSFGVEDMEEDEEAEDEEDQAGTVNAGASEMSDNATAKDHAGLELSDIDIEIVAGIDDELLFPLVYREP